MQALKNQFELHANFLSCADQKFNWYVIGWYVTSWYDKKILFLLTSIPPPKYAYYRSTRQSLTLPVMLEVESSGMLLMMRLARFTLISTRRYSIVDTVCPRGIDPFYKTTCYKIWVKTSWTYSMGRGP